MTGNTPRPNGETVTRHPRFWLLRALPFAPGSNRVRPDSYVYARTPRPTRSRVTRCWWQMSWLAGRCLRPPSQDFNIPVVMPAEG